MPEPRSTVPGHARPADQAPRGVPVPAGPLLVAVQGQPGQAQEAARELASRLGARFAPTEVRLFVVDPRLSEVAIVPLEAAGSLSEAGSRHLAPPAASQGAVAGPASPLGPLLRLGVASGASGIAIVAAEPHDDAVDWLDLLLSPVVEGGYDFVCPAYRRHRTDGAINTGIIAPLLRALYGRALRQPLGTEAALSGGLAARLLADGDWRRRPTEAGSDAWLVTKVLSSEERVAQSWLGAWPRPGGEPEEVSQALSRALGLVFSEMERSADRWQRGGPLRPVASFGSGGFEPGGEPLVPARLHEAFTRGLRDLLPVWSLVLPPATLLALQSAARRPAGDFEIGGELWARIVYDFAVAHLARTVERRQLLRSLTPLYLGWLVGLTRAASSLDDAAFEDRLETVASAFERERRYLIARWRWPDDFNP